MTFQIDGGIPDDNSRTELEDPPLHDNTLG